MDKKLNPLDWEIDLLWDTVSDIIRKLNPLTWRLELVYSADSYIQKINPFIWDFDMVWGTGASYIIKEATWNWYVNLTNAIANHLMQLKAYGWTEQRDLPSWYTQVEYLRSSGTQYIDLGYKGNENTKVDIKFKYYQTASATGSGRVFGSRTSASNNAFAIGSSSWTVSEAANKIFRCYDWQPYFVDDTNFGLTWQTVVFSATEHKINWVTVWDDYEITEFETPSNLSLFGFDNNGTIGIGYVDIAYCKLRNNWVLVRDLIPCKNSSNIFGMYDTVSWTFFENAWTWTFTAWPNATPTPEMPMNIVSNNGVIKFSKNLANMVLPNVVEQYYIDNSWNILSSPVNFYYDTFIPVSPNTAYTLSGSKNFRYASLIEYDINQVFLKRTLIDKANTNAKTWTTGSNTAYVRFWSNPWSNETMTIDVVQSYNFQFERWSVPTPYHEYVEWGVYADWITETIWVHGKNLFDENDVILGYFYNDSGTYTSNNVTYTSGKIPMNAGTTVTFSRGLAVAGVYLRIHAFDSNDNWIGLVAKTSIATDLSCTGTTPANTSYIRVCGAKRASPSTEIDHECQVELGSTATEYVPYYNGDTATAEMLLKIWDYADEQEILSWNVIRKIWIKVLDWTENWTKESSALWNVYNVDILDNSMFSWLVCTHFKNDTPLTDNIIYKSAGSSILQIRYDTATSLAEFKNFLSTEYVNGTPIIVLYALETETTETVAGQTMNIQAWSNTIEITQASIDNLWLYAKYKATA